MTLHEDLRAIRNRVAAGEPRHLLVGICGNLVGNYPTVALETLFEQWGEFSGDLKFPVPHPDLDPRSAFMDASEAEMWAGAYGEARLRLLDFLIERTAPDATQ